jgi:hypothetical protein
VTAPTTSPTPPDLSGFETFYGVPVCYIGEDGDVVALGHHDQRRTIAAMNALARTQAGLRNLIDRRKASVKDITETLSQKWATVEVHNGIGDGPYGYDWYMEWATWDTPGAFPVMLWTQ